MPWETVSGGPDDKWETVSGKAPAAIKPIPPDPAANFPIGGPVIPAFRKATETVINYAPEIGGAVGGVAGVMGGGLPTLGLGAAPAGIFTAGVGGAAGQALKGAVMGTAAPTAQGRATQIGLQGTLQAAEEATGQLGGKALAWAAPKLMQTALKPALSVLSKYKTTAPRLVQTLLDEGVNVSEGGLSKLGRLLAAKNAEIADAVKNAPGLISKDSVLGRLGPAYDRFSAGLDAKQAMSAISEEGGKLIDHPTFPGNTLTVPQAQQMKQAIYSEVRDAYGKVAKPAVEAKKAIARGLKEDIAAEVPGINALNAKESELMAAQSAVGRRVTVAANRDPVGFAWVASHPTTFLAALIDRAPVVKSMVANAMWSSAGAATGISPQLIRLAVHSLASSDEIPPSQGQE